MRVRVTKSCVAAYHGELISLTEGEERFGELAEYLATTGVPVDILEEDAPAEAKPKRGRKAADTPQDPPTPPPADADPVPEGTVDVVLAWVNEDPAKRDHRAAAALAVEQARKTPRAKLVAALEAPAQ